MDQVYNFMEEKNIKASNENKHMDYIKEKKFKFY